MSNLLIPLYVTTSSITILSLGLYVMKYKKEIKNYNEIIAKTSKKVTIDFEKDIKCLDISMKNNVDYFVNNLLSPLMGKQDGGFLRDSDIKEIVTTITLDVISELSDTYIESLSIYIEDVETYIAKRISERITPYIVALNVHKLDKK